MVPQTIRELREYLDFTQEAFASILGVTFATVNRWENGKTVPTGDYVRVLQTLQRLTTNDALGPRIDWQRVGALSAMAAVAGFSPLLTLGAALAPVLIAHLPSWSDVPLAQVSVESLYLKFQGKTRVGSKHVPANLAAPATPPGQIKMENRRARQRTSAR
jgi:transcriptional regulator with XRE-family HTH domain